MQLKTIDGLIEEPKGLEVELDFNTYQQLARETANMTLGSFDRKINWCLGLAGETGELVDMVKKALYHGHALDEQEMTKELGDVVWYVANLAKEYGIELLDVVRANIKKLHKRYPKGFSEKDSINRTE